VPNRFQMFSDHIIWSFVRRRVTTCKHNVFKYRKTGLINDEISNYRNQNGTGKYPEMLSI